MKYFAAVMFGLAVAASVDAMLSRYERDRIATICVEEFEARELAMSPIGWMP